MAVTADYSIVPYAPGKQALGSIDWSYLRPPPPLKARSADLGERRPDPALSGRFLRSPRPQPTYSSRRTIEDSRPALTGLMVDIFV